MAIALGREKSTLNEFGTPSFTLEWDSGFGTLKVNDFILEECLGHLRQHPKWFGTPVVGVCILEKYFRYLGLVVIQSGH